jgi:UDP-N-acetylglucosamine 2-epimerase (non-hydrolysing)
MIDTLVAMSERIDALAAAQELGLPAGGYLVVTLHRPALVDGPLLIDAMQSLRQIAQEYSVVFPVHPRTRAALKTQGLDESDDRLRLLEPIGYFEFLSLVKTSAGVITDSGGIQEETTFLGIPCFTLRDNTERPVTCSHGTNTLLGLEPERILEVPDLLSRAAEAESSIPEGWDGRAAARIVEVLAHAPLPLAAPA